ncbi:flagellar biosynthesis protein FlgA [Micrococcus sp. HG099]|uniref:SAF domain-containing protein n=1 Tax=Micrococcus sp. HG099 TaxID=2969755 RepID=UPI000313C847|nr:SAF domain-containing protein [Micrococcus sp. HG099]MCR8676416.1 flagellar biosynthesis protein FlgA [Micrococcus sp. HG099]
MSTSTSASAEGGRLRRPRWRDPRLLVGLVLVLASVAGVVALVASSQRTSAYWAAAVDLPPGTPLEAGQLRAVEVNLADAEGKYLAAAPDSAPSGRMVASTVRAGELLPAAALVDVDPEGRRPVGVRLREPLAGGVGVGDRVDVWVAMPAEGGRGHADPERLAEALEIAEVATEQGAIGGSGETRVQLLAPEATLPRVVDAQVKDARITLVPAHGVR